MKQVSLVSVLVFILTASYCSHAQYARKYSNEFLNIGVGARGAGMGNAVVASVNDVNAAYWNPAALSGVKDNLQFSLMHSSYYEGTGSYDFVGLAAPVSERGVLGVSLNRFGVDDIVNTLDLVQGGQVDYSRIKTFSATDYAVYISYAHKLKIRNESDSNSFSWGISPKIIYRKVGSFAKAWGFGMDAAARYTHNRWMFGLMLKDVTSTYNTWNITLTDEEKDVFYQTGNDIPLRSTEITLPKVVPGVAYTFKFKGKTRLLVETDLDITFDGRRNVLVSSRRFNIDPHAGLELSLANRIFFRAGLTNIQNILDVNDTIPNNKWVMQPNFGVGLRLKNIHLDYALTAFGGGNVALNSNIFSLVIAINRKPKVVSNTQ